MYYYLFDSKMNCYIIFQDKKIIGTTETKDSALEFIEKYKTELDESVGC